MKSASDLRILMISLDPAFLGQGSGDVLQRHIDYAARVKSLDIILIGGNQAVSKKITDQLTIHSTGGQGLFKAFKAYAIGQRLAAQGIDLIDTQDPHMAGLIGWLLKRKFGLPLEVHCHGDFIANPYWRAESWKNRWYELLQNFIFKRADGIRVVSSLIAAKIEQAQLTKAPVVTINTPVNIEAFPQRLTQPDPAYFTIVSTMRLVAAKNIPFTLEVVAAVCVAHPEVRYRIIGDGPLKSEVERLIADKNLQSHVTLVGSLAPEALAREYAQADCMLLLSTNESFGKVIIEAGAVGVPTIASMTLGAQTIIRSEQTGIVVPINDLKATVAAIERLINDRPACQRLGQVAAIDYRQRFQRTTSLDAIINLWVSMAGN